MSLYVRNNVAALLAAAVAVEPSRPLITYYDDATGERTELSAATIDNWVAKTANLLVDGCGLGPGDRAAIDLPPHWQTAAVLLGCWSVGLELGDAPAADVVFAAQDRLAAHLGTGVEVFGLALAPLAAPMRNPPAGVADYVVEVRGHGDHFTARPTDQRELCERAATRAAELGIRAGDRVLLDTASAPDPLDWLLAPLAATASIVLCAHVDRAKRADRIAAERVTVELDAPPPAPGRR